MAHHKKHTPPVPPANQPQAGPGPVPGQMAQEEPLGQGEVGSFQQQDPKRRLGDFEGAGEHARQQPGGKNDANH